MKLCVFFVKKCLLNLKLFYLKEKDFVLKFVLKIFLKMKNNFFVFLFTLLLLLLFESYKIINNIFL